LLKSVLLKQNERKSQEENKKNSIQGIGLSFSRLPEGEEWALKESFHPKSLD